MLSLSGCNLGHQCAILVDMADGRWCEAEKAFPLKKRRGSFENVTKVNNNNNDNSSNKKKKKTRTKMKMSKKCSMQDDSDDNNEESEEEEEEKAVKTKKRVRGGAIMEGSRCSRVNGRGWRCCQQTLVGYSLCEHHLGKGRLRSMTSVRNRSSATTTQGAAELKKNHVQDHTALSESSPSFPEKKTKCAGSESDEEDNDDEKKPLIVTKKKLGMVKARSISSLLGQANQP